MKNRAAAALALVALAGSLGAQSVTSQRTAPLLVNYDLDSASSIYCRQLGGTLPLQPKDRLQKATTSGSSTTVTAQDSTGEDPFDIVGVGSVLYFTMPSTTTSVGPGVESRYVTAKASADSITVNSAITLPTTGVPFAYTTQDCGTGATAGWFDVKGYTSNTVLIEVTQINTTSGIDYGIECKSDLPWATAVTVISSSTAITAAGTVPLVWSEPYDQCRVRLKLNSTDDGGDTGADQEKVFVTVISRR